MKKISFLWIIQTSNLPKEHLKKKITPSLTTVWFYVVFYVNSNPHPPTTQCNTQSQLACVLLLDSFQSILISMDLFLIWYSETFF